MPVHQHLTEAIRSTRQRGAALILVMLVLASGAIYGILRALNKSTAQVANTQATTASLNQARDALIGFALANRRLPRPATSATNGVEMASCASDAACTGFIPWTTLGVPKLDSWGKIIRYSVSPNFTVAPIAKATAVATKTVQTRNGGGALTSADPLEVNPMPAVIYSPGKNNFGTTDGGTNIPNSSTTNLDEIANNASSTNFITRPLETSNAATGGEFDDLVVWIRYSNFDAQMIKVGW